VVEAFRAFFQVLQVNSATHHVCLITNHFQYICNPSAAEKSAVGRVSNVVKRLSDQGEGKGYTIVDRQHILYNKVYPVSKNHILKALGI
jgi:hypothetical protein